MMCSKGQEGGSRTELGVLVWTSRRWPRPWAHPWPRLRLSPSYSHMVANPAPLWVPAQSPPQIVFRRWRNSREPHLSIQALLSSPLSLSLQTSRCSGRLGQGAQEGWGS